MRSTYWLQAIRSYKRLISEKRALNSVEIDFPKVRFPIAARHCNRLNRGVVWLDTATILTRGNINGRPSCTLAVSASRQIDISLIGSRIIDERIFIYYDLS